MCVIVFLFVPLDLLCKLLYLSWQVDIGLGVKPPGYYIQKSGGLFPVPMPQDSPQLPHVCQLFHLLGMFVAKCLQDTRRVDIPFSSSFFKLMCTIPPATVPNGGELARSLSTESDTSQCMPDDINRLVFHDDTSSPEPGESGDNATQSGGNRPQENRANKSNETAEATNTLEKEKLILLSIEDENEITKDGSKEDTFCNDDDDGQNNESTSNAAAVPVHPWYHGILDHTDLLAIDRHRGSFVQDLRSLVSRRDAILSDVTLSPEVKSEMVNNLLLGDKNKLEDVM